MFLPQPFVGGPGYLISNTIGARKPCRNIDFVVHVLSEQRTTFRCCQVCLFVEVCVSYGDVVKTENTRCSALHGGGSVRAAVLIDPVDPG